MAYAINAAAANFILTAHDEAVSNAGWNAVLRTYSLPRITSLLLNTVL